MKKVFRIVLANRQQRGLDRRNEGQLPGKEMLEHHGGVETAIPHFRGAVVSVFQLEVILHALVAAFGGSPGVVLNLPFLGISGRDVDEPWVVLGGKMDGAAPFGVRAGVGAGAGLGAAVHQRAAELGAMLGYLHTIMAHFKTGHADGDAVRPNGEIIFVLEFHALLFVESDEGDDALPTAVFIDRHSVMGRVKEQFGDSVRGQKIFMVKKQCRKLWESWREAG